MRITILLSMMLFFSIGISFAQSLSEAEFEQQCNSIGKELVSALDKGDYKKGEQECKLLIKVLQSRSERTKQSYNEVMCNVYYNLACCQSMQKKKSAAIKSLEMACQYNYRNYRHALKDTDLDFLRNDKRFKAILAGLKEVGDYHSVLQKAPGYATNQRADTLPRFTYANPNDSNLVRVRQYFKLDSVAGAGDELSKIKNILTYVHNKIKHDGNHPNPPVANAIGMAEACKDGSRGLNCRGLSTVLNECYLAMGFKSRFITCMPKVYINDCHVINVVYSNTLDKWIWADPTHNAWVMDENGTLLGIREVRERLRNGQPLVLNEEANWNNVRKTTAESYLYDYMAKNLYYVNCTFCSRFGTEEVVFSPKNYVALMPVGYVSEQEKGCYVVNDDAWFWQSPYQE